ncbi:MAG TPA: mucoidy inhibitor MuiA family protein [Desulfobacterales bacterium]|nr:mucoidy inhibitor MuiA family protein [Desulfobacterales bacterium]
MKKWLFFWIVTFMMFLIPVPSEAEIVPSRIREATLFSDQAYVIRSAEISAVEGFNEIRLSVDAFQVDPDSVSAKVFGEGQILGVQYREIPVEEPVQENVRALENRLRDLRWKERSILDEREILGKKETFLNSVTKFSETQIPQDIKTNFPRTEDLQGVLAFLGDRFDELAGRKASIDRELEEISKKIKVIEEELNMVRRPARKVEKVIEVLYQGSKSQNVRVEAGYLVRHAFWSPLYRVSVPLSFDRVDLTMFSSILQKTGENWTALDLSVSNLIPLKGARIPELNSWILDIPRPLENFGAKKSLAADRARMAQPMAVLKEEMAGTGQEAAFAETEKKELPLSFEYRFPRPVDIESRDKETVLPLFTRKIEGTFFDLAVPRVSPLTFLVCRAKGDGEILAGPLNVYFGGRYVGKTFLSEKKPGEAFDFNLGADREVKVTRTKITDKIRETYFGRVERETVVREIAYRIRMENRKKQPVTLQVLDAVPFSRTDRMEVKDVKLFPEPAEKNYREKQGVHLWRTELKPGETKEISIAFVVTYPRESPPPDL